jgi:hypothetical protein
MMSHQQSPRFCSRRQYIVIDHAAQSCCMRGLKVDARLTAQGGTHDDFVQIGIGLEPDLHERAVNTCRRAPASLCENSGSLLRVRCRNASNSASASFR